MMTTHYRLCARSARDRRLIATPQSAPRMCRDCLRHCYGRQLRYHMTPAIVTRGSRLIVLLFCECEGKKMGSQRMASGTGEWVIWGISREIAYSIFCPPALYWHTSDAMTWVLHCHITPHTELSRVCTGRSTVTKSRLIQPQNTSTVVLLVLVMCPSSHFSPGCWG